MVELDERQADMCPICKTDRYLSPDMKFLVNPECYHKMCESCVDRIFAMGPAPCPYPGCGKILRKNKFKAQIFDDIGVEREVDVRKRVSEVFNKAADDFDDLDSFNKYLEDVEEIVFNLVNSVDIEDTERKLKAYEESNKANIEENKRQRQLEQEDFKRREELEQEYKVKKMLLEREVEQEDKRDREETKKQVLDSLATKGDAEQEIEKAQKSMLKRSSARKRRLNEQLEALRAANAPKKEEEEDLKIPFTPFNGDRITQKQWTTHDHYYDPFIDELKVKKDYLAGGFNATDVYERILSEAFLGLNCFIEREKASAPLPSN
ncbi:CYFA0S11e03290g1_1 [Cyberlindnera fabianii]|uniref:RNA polymerase II transcription factor B subunit 3 n=2 Tax=Cyberlindnera fabianii TaxID=36022 RepID=A0A061B041_CYBFA|nr:CYFA0S11e03290g1_1 [Cyberlindnera fabianii]